ncbi:hypothetical protein N7519_001623 [Penicillium mononematosum]|uniref:uncharacterized protein n=1 Tax=Penicillium mononematosum TaxID=268346 RepID=UPI002549A56C|nr:uncharacterized protein N7519_001623 [Penicillium mononematosum]KAJ6191602.1 hypothetical protein N7519_001623 [Penicillium mononematosum]
MDSGTKMYQRTLLKSIAERIKALTRGSTRVTQDSLEQSSEPEAEMEESLFEVGVPQLHMRLSQRHFPLYNVVAPGPGAWTTRDAAALSGQRHALLCAAWLDKNDINIKLPAAHSQPASWQYPLGHDNDPALPQKRFRKEFKFANARDSMSMHNVLVTYCCFGSSSDVVRSSPDPGNITLEGYVSPCWGLLPAHPAGTALYNIPRKTRYIQAKAFHSHDASVRFREMIERLHGERLTRADFELLASQVQGSVAG